MQNNSVSPVSSLWDTKKPLRTASWSVKSQQILKILCPLTDSYHTCGDTAFILGNRRESAYNHKGSPACSGCNCNRHYYVLLSPPWYRQKLQKQEARARFQQYASSAEQCRARVL